MLSTSDASAPRAYARARTCFVSPFVANRSRSTRSSASTVCTDDGGQVVAPRPCSWTRLWTCSGVVRAAVPSTATSRTTTRLWIATNRRPRVPGDSAHPSVRMRSLAGLGRLIWNACCPVLVDQTCDRQTGIVHRLAAGETWRPTLTVQSRAHEKTYWESRENRTRSTGASCRNV